MDNFLSNIDSGLIILAVIVVIFLVLREMICWYWKINQNVALLTEIRDLLVAKGISQDRVTSTATTSVSSNSSASVPSREDLAPSDEKQMETYGITYDGECYSYGEYKYENLSDAVNYAKRQYKR